MKLSIVLSTQPASFSALAYKGQLAEKLKKIRDLGYHGVELAVRDPDLLDHENLKDLLKENNLPVPAIGTGQAYGEEGLSFTHPDPSIRKKAIERIKAQVRLAHELDAVVIIGLIRGTLMEGVKMKQAEDWMRDAMDECAAEDESVKLAIEPINRYETDLLITVESALKFVNVLNRDNVGLLLDTFHMNIEEASPVDSIYQTRHRLFHFHIADSNRWYPGAGHINFGDIKNHLDQIGYQGFLSAEILPMPDPDTAAEKTIETMNKII